MILTNISKLVYAADWQDSNDFMAAMAADQPSLKRRYNVIQLREQVALPQKSAICLLSVWVHKKLFRSSNLSQIRANNQGVIAAPPSILNTWPVMYAPAFDDRKSAAPAISSGCPKRRSGSLLFI